MPADPGGAGVRPDADRGGPDIGLVLACAGLLLAAAVLGLTEDGRRATTRTRSKLLAALPAFGGADPSSTPPTCPRRPIARG